MNRFHPARQFGVYLTTKYVLNLLVYILLLFKYGINF